MICPDCTPAELGRRLQNLDNEELEVLLRQLKDYQKCVEQEMEVREYEERKEKMREMLEEQNLLTHLDDYAAVD